jgi:putative flippase GtrA
MIASGPRYVGVSLFCLLFNNALFILLDWLGVHYVISVIISVAIMIPLGFVLQSRATFGRTLNWAAFGRYTLVMLANPPVALLLFWLVHDLGGLRMIYAAPIVTLSMLAWNFLTSSWAILLRAPQIDTAKDLP